MGRIIVANRRGHQVVEWNTTDTDEARATVEEAERILREGNGADRMRAAHARGGMRAVLEGLVAEAQAVAG